MPSDKTAIGISDLLRKYIEALVEEVVIEGKPFDNQKKSDLQSFSQEEGVDYVTLEKNLTGFFEAVEELKSHESKAVERLAKILAKDCYLEEGKVNELLEALNEAREKEERERKTKEEEERRRGEKDSKEAEQREKERLEAEHKAKEAAEQQEKMKKAEALFQQWANFAKTGLDNKKAEECIHLLMESAALGYPKAQNHLSQAYKFGWGVKQNIEEAFRLSMASALQDNRGGQCAVGIAYLYGNGVEPNDELAFLWLSKSAQAGSPVGMVYLAICYRYGIGTARNLEQAEQLISKAKEIAPQSASFFLRITDDNTYEHIESVRSKKAE